jgi:inhibitor of cysteine peptidase
MRIVTLEQNGSTIDVELWSSFELQLTENPTTGYRWHFRSSGEPVVQAEELPFQIADERIGAGGLRRWVFRAAQAGSTLIELEHRRVWEKQATAKFSLGVQVKPA